MNTVRIDFLSLVVTCGLSLSAAVRAESCNLSIDANDAMQYSAKRMDVPTGCTDITVTLRHTGKMPAKAMGHNWVLTRKADAGSVAAAGVAAGAAKDYLPERDARVLAATKVIGGGETTSVTFSANVLKAGEEYAFFCSFPGHASMMKGNLVLAR